MSPRSLWTIIIKGLGIYVLLQGLMSIPSIINMAEIFYSSGFPDSSTQAVFFESIYMISLLIVFWLIIWGCVIKTEWIINNLKLNNGIIEEKLGFRMHRSDILKVVVMIIGGVTLIDSLPAAFQEFFLCIQHLKEYNGFMKDPKCTYLLFYIIKVGIGVFMLTSSRLIVNFIDRRRREVILD
jgi:hypothetical protein